MYISWENWIYNHIFFNNLPIQLLITLVSGFESVKTILPSIENKVHHSLYVSTIADQYLKTGAKWVYAPPMLRLDLSPIGSNLSATKLLANDVFLVISLLFRGETKDVSINKNI